MVSGPKLQPLHLLLINCSQFVSFMILIIIIIIILFSFATAESNAKGRHIFFTTEAVVGQLLAMLNIINKARMVIIQKCLILEV